MDKQTSFTGKAWVIVGADGRLIHDIDTDMIYHNAHLAVTEIDEMGRHAFGNLSGWVDFPARVSPGDILVVGGNFGAGSSRQHAVDCFAALGVAAVVAASYGAIYKRNAINSGFPILEWPELATLDPLPLATGDVITLDLPAATLETRGERRALLPFSQVQMDVYQAGSLFAFGKQGSGT